MNAVQSTDSIIESQYRAGSDSPAPAQAEAQTSGTLSSERPALRQTRQFNCSFPKD